MDEQSSLIESGSSSVEPERGWWARQREWLGGVARRVKTELVALWIASTDSRVPLYAKIFATIVLALALSPIDIVPDFIPVLGLLDDLIVIPLGLWLTLQMIPDDVMQDARRAASEMDANNEVRLPANYYAAAVIVALWLIFIALLVHVACKMGTNSKCFA